MLDATSTDAEQQRASPWILGVLVIVSIGAIDFYSGVELRVFPLYYAPVALLAWHSGRAGALIATVLCGAAWLASNALAGLQYANTGTWVVNALMQSASFVTVGLLIATVNAALKRERGLSRTDTLTSMRNRLGFYEEAARILASCRRAERPVTVAYVDLDHFKAVNDRLGHQRGDDVLRTVAGLIGASIRPSDVAARLGGDEFVILFPEIGPTEAALTLERLRSSIADTLASGPSPVTSSIGGVTFVRVPERVEDLVKHGDSMLYSAKTSGRNRVALDVVGPPLEPNALGS